MLPRLTLEEGRGSQRPGKLGLEDPEELSEVRIPVQRGRAEQKEQSGLAAVLRNLVKVRCFCGGASLPIPAKMHRDDVKEGKHLSSCPRAVLRAPNPLSQGTEPSSSTVILGASVLLLKPLWTSGLW